MEASQQESEIKISISGTVSMNGHLADYTQFLKAMCCLIAMDLDRSGNIKNEYLIAHVLFEHIRTNAQILPKCISYRDKNSNGLITNLRSLDCNVKVLKFTEHPYTSINNFSCSRMDVVKYFVGDNTVVRLSYDLTISIVKFLEKNRKQLELENYSVLVLKTDNVVIDYLKYLHQKFGSKPFDLKELSILIAENIKTLAGHELLMAPPEIDKLNAALESKLTNAELESKVNINLNSVE